MENYKTKVKMLVPVDAMPLDGKIQKNIQKVKMLVPVVTMMMKIFIEKVVAMMMNFYKKYEN